MEESTGLGAGDTTTAPFEGRFLMARPLRVLVVDDLPENRERLEAQLAAAGHTTKTCQDEREALQALGAETFDAIVADVSAPLRDGYRLCRACKANPALRPIPFVFFTSHPAAERDRAFALSLGAQAFLSGPPEQQDFWQRLRAAISSHDGVEPKEHPPQSDHDSLDAATAERLAPADGGTTPRILVVDDDVLVSEVIGRMLLRLGYQVAIAHGAVEARAAFAAASACYDLLVTDLTMPDGNGFEVVRDLRAMDPELPVILCSGFLEAPDFERARRDGIDEVITKPVHRVELERCVREALARRGARVAPS